MFNISLVEDDSFEEITLPSSQHEGEKIGYKYKFHARSDFNSEMVIAPHFNETYISFELFQLSLYCKKNKIKLTSIGSMNQFPFFGLFSDEVICLKDTHLHNIYASNYSSFGTDGSYFSKIPNFVDIYGGGMGMHGFHQHNEISLLDVINAFSFPPIFIRRSTYDFFKSLDLPSDIPYCEIKLNFYPKLVNLVREVLPDSVGLDKKFQKELLQKSKDHFMGIQLLASLYKNWHFIAAGGSVNLFNVLPVRPLCFLENDTDLKSEYINISKTFAQKRYGVNPIFINFSPRICVDEVIERDDISLGNQEAFLRKNLPITLSENLQSSVEIKFNKTNNNSINKISSFKFDNEIKIKIGNKIINWVFQYHHDFNFFKTNILNWAIPSFEFSENDPDFTVGVFINDQKIFEKFNSLASQKFLISAEAHTRHPELDNCHSFVQDGRPHDNLNYIRYSPTMTCWSPALKKNQGLIETFSSLSSPPISISAIDSGRYQWRNELVKKISNSLNSRLDIYGGLGHRPIGGYHSNTSDIYLNEKYKSLSSYFFHLAIENDTAKYSKEDYITEKVTDPIMCETLPICQSAPNLSDYFIEGSYVLLSEIENLDLNNLPNEYKLRRDSLLQQKELLRTHFNVFSYFNKLTDDLSLLNEIRPIKIA